MVFQSLGIFKSKSEPVTAPGDADLLPRDQIVVASKEADAQMVRRGTSVSLKDVENPDKGDIEADFAFMSDILSKAGVLEGQQPEPAQVAAPVSATPMAPARSSAPDFVPMHKRGANADSGKPVFAVQDGPRSAKPSFLPDAPEAPIEPPMSEIPVAIPCEQVAVAQQVPPHAVCVPVVSVQPIPFQAVVAAPAPVEAQSDQMSLPFDAEPTPVPETKNVQVPPSPLPVPTAVDPSVGVHAAAPVQMTVQEARPTAELEPASPEEIANALEILELRPNATPVAKADEGTVVEFAPVANGVTKRKSMFASRSKSAKPPKYKREQAVSDVEFEPPKLMRKLMSAIPTAEVSQGMSDYAKARLARDPFDRLLDEAQGC